MEKSHKISVVVSVYNEEDVLDLFWREVRKNLEDLHTEYEVIFVNDGSTDGSRDVLSLLCAEDSRVKVVHLSRNFGHEAAMIAGIDHSTGDAVVCMDADLQHPPEMLREMVECYERGNEVITMVRRENRHVGFIKRSASACFYSCLNLLSTAKFEPNASDFFLISRRVADIIRKDFTERARFMRGFIQIVGFRRSSLEYCPTRRAAGTSKYSFLRLVALSASAIVSFSNVPLRISMLVGVVIALFSVLVGVFSIVVKLFGYVIPGYTTIVVLITFLFAFQLIILGIIGEYLGYIFNEIKKRPLYIVEEVIGQSLSDQSRSTRRISGADGR